MPPASFALPSSEILAKPVQPDAAMAFWQSRAAMTREEARALSGGAKARAFYVTGLAERDQIQTVKDAIGAALAKGETIADFKGRIGEVIARAGWRGDRIDNIFRTNMQTAYAAGRYAKMQAVKKERPYWQYYTIEDRRRRPSHAVLHGMVYPADHEFWARNYTPNGFRCRCGVRTLSPAQVEDMGLTVQTDMPGDMLYTDPVTGMEYHVQRPGADAGFAQNVGKDWLAGLDLQKYPDLGPQSYDEQRGPTSKRPAPVKTYDDLCAAIKERCGDFCTNAGIHSVQVQRSNQFLMGTDCRGGLYLSNYSFGDGYNAAKELKSAWNKLSKGKSLTWNEEYSVESLWHEITHNRQKRGNLGRGETPLRRSMEVVTQWTARRTYTQLLESLGGKASHQADILKNGLGYGRIVGNFDRLLAALGITDEDLLPYMQGIIERFATNEYDSELKDVLAKLSGKNFMQVAGAMDGLNARNFEEVLRLYEFIE